MKISLKNVRLAFPELFVAKQFQSKGDFKYSATFLIPKTNKTLISQIEEAIKTVATEKWGAKADKILERARPIPNNFNFRDGDERDDYEGFEGCMYLRASNKSRPLVIDVDKSPLAEQDGRPYSGCFVNANVSFFAYDNEFGKGISASLGGVQFFKDGDAFTGGGVSSVDDFEDLSVEEESLV